jgi:hypothetical protein
MIFAKPREGKNSVFVTARFAHLCRNKNACTFVLQRVAKAARAVAVKLVQFAGFITLLFGLSFALLLEGCAETVKWYVSVPERVPADVSGSISDDIVRLSLEDVNVSVQMQNYLGVGGPGLGVWLSLETKGEGFSLDPGRVVLKTDSGESLTPVGFLGPDKPWQSPRSFGMGCGPRRYNLGWALSKIDLPRAVIMRPAGAVPFLGLSCVMLGFLTDPSPDRGFILAIAGIRKGDQPIAVPELSFRKGLVSRFLLAREPNSLPRSDQGFAD